MSESDLPGGVATGVFGRIGGLSARNGPGGGLKTKLATGCDIRQKLIG